MTRQTDQPSAEDVPAKQTGEPPTAEDIPYGSAYTAINPFLAGWLHAIASDGSLPPEALEVANAMARSVGIGRVAFTDWQRINTALGRHRMDLAVFETMSELALEGYLDRDVDDEFVYGWSMLIPGAEL
jgi:hypothetical protein